MYRYLTNLADVLRAEGLKVEEVYGWKTRGRPKSAGGFDPVGVACHHTATYKGTPDRNVVQLLVNGRPDLPGPLCQLGLGRDGTVYVIAAGRGNHAGSAKSSGTVAAGDGNSLYIGIEAFNDGRGEPWPQVQYDAYVKLCAVLCLKVTGNSVNTVRGHKEISLTGKIDPTFDMDRFRTAVAAMTKPEPKPEPEPVLTADIRVATWNIGDGKGKVRDLHNIARDADVIALQEAGDRGKELAAFLVRHPFWAMYRPNDAPGQASLPFLYRRLLFEVVGSYAEPAVEARNVGPNGAGPSTTKPKWVTRLHLVHKETGRTLHVLNTHMIPSVTRTNLPAAELDARRKHYADHVDALDAVIAARAGVVVVCADLNAPKGFDLLAPLMADLEGWSTAATHGQRAIDHVLYRLGPAISNSGHRVVKTTSDHNAVIATFTLTERD